MDRFPLTLLTAGAPVCLANSAALAHPRGPMPGPPPHMAAPTPAAREAGPPPHLPPPPPAPTHQQPVHIAPPPHGPPRTPETPPPAPPAARDQSAAHTSTARPARHGARRTWSTAGTANASAPGPRALGRSRHGTARS